MEAVSDCGFVLQGLAELGLIKFIGNVMVELIQVGFYPLSAT